MPTLRTVENPLITCSQPSVHLQKIEGSTSRDSVNHSSCTTVACTLESESEVKVAQSCLTLCNPMDYTVQGLLQARILELGSLSKYLQISGSIEFKPVLFKGQLLFLSPSLPAFCRKKGRGKGK